MPTRQYAYDYVKNPVVSDGTRWSSNGSVSFSSIGATFSGSSGGSLISAVPITVEAGGSANDYEVTSTLALNSGGGTYMHFFRTSSGTVMPGSKCYISRPGAGYSEHAVGAATLNVNQRVSGTVTTLGSTMVWATNGMTFRTVIFGGALWIYVNNAIAFQVAVGTTGNPASVGYNMPSGSGFAGIELGHHDTVAPFPVSGTSVASSVFLHRPRFSGRACWTT